MTEALALLGEIRTNLLPNADALSEAEVSRLLPQFPGQRIAIRERPLARATSPGRAIGVDCDLANHRGAESRAVGTVDAHAVVIGGRVAQSSARVRVVRALVKERRPWSHYLTRVGTLELIHNKLGNDAATALALAEGHLELPGDETTLDLGSICELLLNQVLTDPRLERRQPPLRTAATCLRWVARVVPPAGEEPPDRIHLNFRLEQDGLRKVRIEVPTAADLAGVQHFCEDLAVHDWLLTTFGAALGDVARTGPNEDPVGKLAPLLESLAHLWMPGAHSPRRFRRFWDGLEADPGFTAQWTAQVGQMRDRMTAATLAALRSSKISTARW
ncbi:SCO2521 family protein [Nocardia yamanashiensis]|uniref:SCO2521 family protein n=1 Tax=Nocardia yamanashiensis TaxID=209247 RepID=UPI0008346E0C|nr:SCO2521 family protein [Nocardia yamanashiensis]